MVGRAWFETLGCKANQYESRSLRAALAGLGWRAAASPTQADLIVINTCAVTAEAERKSRQALRRARRLAPSARVAALGCLIAALRSRGNEMPDVDFALGDGARQGREQFFSWLGGIPGAVEPALGGQGDRTRALLKVQDGCNGRCTYCIVPSLRGPSCSRPVAEVLAEARPLWGAGVPEVVLTGVCLGSWREGAMGLDWLVRALVRLPGRTRVRLSSLEPHLVSKPLLEAMAEVGPEQVCPHLHLSLQHGSDKILERMGRPYDRASFLEKVAMARSVLAEPVFSTDVIVGFPGEDEQDLEATLAVLGCLEPVRVHVFPFSAREGTPAWGFPGRLSPSRIQGRSGQVRRFAEELACRAASQRIGSLEDVVLEKRRTGLSARYQRVMVVGGGGEPGERFPVLITAARGPSLTGRRHE